MPLLKEEADKLYQSPLEAGVLETIITEDELFEVLPFEKSGAAYLYTREATITDAEFLDAYDDVPEGGSTSTDHTVKLKRLIGDVDVDKFIDENQSAQNSQKAVQIASKAKSVARQFKNAFVNGNSKRRFMKLSASAGYKRNLAALTSVTGVSVLSAVAADDAQAAGDATIGFTATGTLLAYTAPGDSAGTGVNVGAGGRFTLASGNGSDKIEVDVSAGSLPGGNQSDTVIMSKTGLEYDGLLTMVDNSKRISAGVNGAALAWSHLDELEDAIKAGDMQFVTLNERTRRAYKALLRSAGGVDSAMLQLPNLGRPVLTFSGVPVLKNNWIPTNQTHGTATSTTSIIAGRFGQKEGVVGLYGGGSAGIRIEDVGTVQSKDASRTRVKWYCGAANENIHGLAVYEGITN